MTRREMAEQYFTEGYNCAQSTVKAFSDLLPVDEKTALKLASSFGGGMGRLREVCGAVSGMFMVFSLLYGYDTPETGDVKLSLYSEIQELAHRFEALHGTIVCRELLGLAPGHDTPVPEPRTQQYYEKRPCAAFIGDAAEILDNYMKELREKEGEEK